MKGCPITCNTYGKGKAYYLGFHSDDDFYFDIYQDIISKAKLHSNWESELPLGVSAQIRENEDARYTFLMNFRDEEVQIKVPNPDKYLDLLKKETPKETLEIPAYGYIILKTSKE